jgi:hypothetical protein
MTHHTTAIPTDFVTRRPRRRAPRTLSLLGPVPDVRTAEAMDDEHAAQELMNDLLALIEAGLIAPVEQEGTVRYAIADPDDVAA